MKKRVLSLLLVLVMVLGTLPIAAFAEAVPFSVTVGGEAVTEIVKGTLTNYGQDWTLYTITIPAGTETVTLTWDQEVVGFSTDETNDECWDFWDDDPHATIDVSTDGNEDGILDYLYVSEDLEWMDEELTYFITFVEEAEASGDSGSDDSGSSDSVDVPFSVTADGEAAELSYVGEFADKQYGWAKIPVYLAQVSESAKISVPYESGYRTFGSNYFSEAELVDMTKDTLQPYFTTAGDYGLTTENSVAYVELRDSDFNSVYGVLIELVPASGDSGSDDSGSDDSGSDDSGSDDSDSSNPDAAPFSVTVGSEAVTGIVKGTLTNYGQDWTLYTITIPAGTETVTLTWDQEVVGFSTDETNDECWDFWDDDPHATIDVSTDGNEDGILDYLYVSEDLEWMDEELTYFITFVEEAKEVASAYWPNFRNSLYNMALTDAKTPAAAATTAEKWVGSYASGWSTPSGMIIADNALIFMCGNTLKKVDLQTGAVIAEGTMSASCGFAIISPTYADGMIFCPLSGGKIEAFDVKTLESVWLFTDELGGQNNTVVTYAGGYLYTGYWNGETKDANFVCVNAATGELVWSKTVPGGFYWAGSTVVGDAVIVGSDDGASGFDGNSHLFALNKLTGEVISDITLTGMGDMRSCVAYSAEKGRVYFTTKNGYIASAAVDAASGVLSDLKSSKVAAQATSTPVVYGDKVFVSVGSGMREGSTAGTYVVADANTLESLYEIPMLGYGQGSTLVSTAYLAETGKLYCYATYNNKPGGLTLIKIDPTKNDASGAEVEEVYAAPGYEEYCLISPICGSDGTIYYRNDSGYIFALTTNEAYLTGLTADAGTFSKEFEPKELSYELVVPIGTETVTLTPTACEGGAAEAVTVTLAEGKATATVTVTKDASSRSYTVSIREISADATLGELSVNESNSYTGTALEMTPAFAADTYYYGVYTVGDVRNFVNVWPTAADANASVAVYALSNVNTETSEIAVTATNQDHDRYAIYFADDTKPAAIRIVVTAENGDTAAYILVLTKEAAAEAGAALLETLKNCDHAGSTVTGAQAATCTENGYTGDKTCPDCGYTEKGEVITASGHSYVDGVCTVCGEADPDYKTAEGDVDVYVTIADKGNVVVAQQAVTVTDVNHNGIFDVDDALYAAHEKLYTGGAAAGYASYESDWGLSISKLWGDTSYCYGYWLNNASCWSLEDVVAEGNHLVAFVYADATNWSDAYTKFEKFDYAVEAETALTVKLEKAGYDESWNTVFAAHAGATVTVYDAQMKAVNAVVTDNGDGTYTVTVDAAGTYYLVATDSDPLTVPAVSCLVVTAKAAEPETPTEPSTPPESGTPQTGDQANVMFYMIAMLASAACAAVVLLTSKKKYAGRYGK